MRRFTPWLLITLALLVAPALARAQETLVLDVATAVTTTGAYGATLQNRGPKSIFCQRGAPAGLAVNKGVEILPRSSWYFAGPGDALYCISSVAQVAGAATNLMVGVQQGGPGDGIAAQAVPDATALSTTAVGLLGAVKMDQEGRALVRFDHPNRFSCGVTGQAASLLQCAAAAAAGFSYYITDIVAQTSTGTAGTWAVQSGTGTNCGSNTATVFPAPPMTTAARFTGPINTQPPFVYAPSTPLKVTQGHALCAIGAATNTLNIQISGYIAP